METDPYLQQIEKQFPDAILEVKPLGRGKFLSIWIESKQIVNIATFLKEHPEGQFEFLENIVALDFNGSVILTYFLSSLTHKKTIILRVSAAIKQKDSELSLPSVQPVWLSAVPFEDDINHLFGVQFIGKLEAVKNFLPRSWVGYPLRKDYVFPENFLNFPHSRLPFRDITKNEAPHGD